MPTNYQHLYYKLASLETRRVLNLLKTALPEEDFSNDERHLEAGEFGIVAGGLVELVENKENKLPEEVYAQLDILTEVMGFNQDEDVSETRTVHSITS